MAFGSKTAGAVHERYHRPLKTAADPHEWAYAWRTELNRGGFPAVRFIMDEIVNAQKCAGGAECGLRQHAVPAGCRTRRPPQRPERPARTALLLAPPVRAP